MKLTVNNLIKKLEKLEKENTLLSEQNQLLGYELEKAIEYHKKEVAKLEAKYYEKLFN